ncbi:MAG: hypothetical protein E7564_02335 [Ruminococcaceae bacterium]|nr:hypothetical protein [Oscillospiraceae bacterium]
MYNPETKKLKFNENGKFKILMISDFHAQGNFNGVGRARFRHKMIKGIELLLNETKPDFVMLGGDQCISSGDDMPQISKEEDMNLAYEALKEIMAPVNERGIPWAFVNGNHDEERCLSKEELFPVYKKFPLCLAEKGPEDIYGVGNYVLPVYSSKNESIAYNIFALDSNNNTKEYLREFGIKEEDDNIVLPRPFCRRSGQAMPFFNQVMWYYNTSRETEIKEGRKIPAILCMHNPCIEFNHIVRNPEETKMIGDSRDSMGYSELNSGLFFACLERGDVKGIFCGHEHLNNFQGKYCGITLAYDSCVGFDMTAHDDLRGGRLIELDENNGSFETRHITFMSLMGDEAIRDPERTFFDYETNLGKQNYNIRFIHMD